MVNTINDSIFAKALKGIRCYLIIFNLQDAEIGAPVRILQ